MSYLVLTETWEIVGKLALLPSLGKVGLFKGNLITLCGRLKAPTLTIQGTSILEEFEVIKFVEESAPFPLLFGKAWLEKEQLRKKREEETLIRKKK